jgi:hypothetical protein
MLVKAVMVHQSSTWWCLLVVLPDAGNNKWTAKPDKLTKCFPGAEVKRVGEGIQLVSMKTQYVLIRTNRR